MFSTSWHLRSCRAPSMLSECCDVLHYVETTVIRFKCGEPEVLQNCLILDLGDEGRFDREAYPELIL
ncbi:hypothetical protein B296_00032449 [Ensete ventricosum]|uniref:Uncharacterized protein n=1 Tax=Ensete ventricosum TaxID=4639 RepID=A0A426ZFT3_ENSVE|nr:hypothetical protein B296_00032449 [Ensete ventricosum]